ncbi:MAG TPA: hypothetical protein VLG09_05855 [Candidatus Saccharimonadales bacterium]|nr:hypothetical protein [Candidatus Saccharimonadales bacterium]
MIITVNTPDKEVVVDKYPGGDPFWAIIHLASKYRDWTSMVIVITREQWGGSHDQA